LLSEEVGHCLWTFTIPKMLRVFFLPHRELLGRLWRAGWEVVRELMAAAAGDPALRPGMIGVVRKILDHLATRPGCSRGPPGSHGALTATLRSGRVCRWPPPVLGVRAPRQAEALPTRHEAALQADCDSIRASGCSVRSKLGSRRALGGCRPRWYAETAKAIPYP